MYLSLKTNKTPKEHKVLLLLSIVVVSSFLYALFYGYKEITTPLVKQPLVKERVLALVINPAPMKKEVIKEIKKEKIIKKETPKPLKKEVLKKEIVKEKVVEKPVEQEVIKEVVEQKVVEHEIVEEIVQKQIVDAKAKESFIADLYELLNENKHYPKMAKRRKLEGVCEVSFTLSKDGKIKDVFLKKACGHSILDTAALKVVRSVEFYKPIPDSVSLSSLHLNIPIKYARN